MSDEEEALADASWAAGLMDADDFADLQTSAAAIVEGKEVFYLGIVQYVSDAKALVEAALACDRGTAVEEDFMRLNAFMGEAAAAFASMCIEHGVLPADFWKDQSQG